MLSSGVELVPDICLLRRCMDRTAGTTRLLDGVSLLSSGGALRPPAQGALMASRNVHDK